MESTKQSWEDYLKILIKFQYTPEQIEAVKEVRENYDLCPYEQFRELFLQGVIERVAKVKKPRNYFVNEEGEFLYLNHRNHKYEIAAVFKL
jgi:hypothetical protein|nr:MAG TPA: hypothetical protein [Caudoviricetes sp.]